MGTGATMKAIDSKDCKIDYETVAACIALPLRSLCRDLKYPIQSFIEDGLGPAQGVSLRLRSDRCAALYESLIYSERNSPVTNIIVERNPNHIETDTIEVLTALGVNVEHVVIQHPGLMTTHASLMRTDDNGVEYEIHHALPLWQASLMVQRYQDNKHKQHYWVRHLASDSTTN